MPWLFAVILSILQLCAATPLGKYGTMVKKHSWVKIPRGWGYESHAPANFTFTVRMALKPKGTDDLITVLMETSNPKNTKYVFAFSLTHREKLTERRIDTGTICLQLKPKHLLLLTRRLFKSSKTGSRIMKSLQKLSSANQEVVSGLHSLFLSLRQNVCSTHSIMFIATQPLLSA